MPIYEYECEKCGHHFEILQKVSDKPLIKCPKCDTPALKKLVSLTSFKLKGNGWYATDFKDKKPAAKKEKPKENKKGEKDA